MMRTAMFSLAAMLALAFAPGCGSVKGSKPGCAKDTDCKGARVCESGKCMSLEAAAEIRAKAKAKAGGKSAAKPASPSAQATPPTPPGGPGTIKPFAAPPPSNPGAPGGSPLAGLGLKVCINGQCSTLGQKGAMRQLFGALTQGLLGGVLGGGGKKADIKICVGANCLQLGGNKGSGGGAGGLMQFFRQLAPMLFKNFGGLGKLFGGGGKPGSGGGFLGRLFGGKKGAPTPPAPPANPNQISYRSFADIAAAGNDATGKVAELAQMRILSVTPQRLVVQAENRAMIILRLPTGNAKLHQKIRHATGRVTVRFQIAGPAVGKLLNGTLLSFTPAAI